MNLLWPDFAPLNNSWCLKLGSLPVTLRKLWISPSNFSPWIKLKLRIKYWSVWMNWLILMDPSCLHVISSSLTQLGMTRYVFHQLSLFNKGTGCSVLWMFSIVLVANRHDYQVLWRFNDCEPQSTCFSHRYVEQSTLLQTRQKRVPLNCSNKLQNWIFQLCIIISGLF